MILTVLVLGLLSVLSPFILAFVVMFALELYERRRKVRLARLADDQLLARIDRAGGELKREHPISREIAVSRGLKVYREQVQREGVTT